MYHNTCIITYVSYICIITYASYICIIHMYDNICCCCCCCCCITATSRWARRRLATGTIRTTGRASHQSQNVAKMDENSPPFCQCRLCRKRDLAGYTRPRWQSQTKLQYARGVNPRDFRDFTHYTELCRSTPNIRRGAHPRRCPSATAVGLGDQVASHLCPW